MNKRLSIIMPLYNVEDTLQIALDSILMQQINFDYEIIAVDDASTDTTLDILEKNSKIYPQIKIIKHENNLGNAVSFYDGLCASCGDYFCVLDGDDYYTVKYKLQKQVDFLDSDKDRQYVAVSHKYLKVDSNGNIFNTNLFTNVLEFDYYNYLRHIPYNHTTTYMYRNIFRYKVPEFFKEEYCRGDNPRTFFHVLFTKGKIKILNFVGSVYRYSNNGIWSRASQQKQRERNIWMYECLAKHLYTHKEEELFLKNVKARFSSSVSSVPIVNSKEYFLSKLYGIANKYAFKNREFVFKSIYKSTFVDSFCESLGYVEKVSRGISFSTPLKLKENNILIAISKLTTTGGGVYYEIKDIIEMYSGKNVFLLLTDLDSEDEINKDVLDELFLYKNLTIVFGQRATENKIANLFDKIVSIAPEKVYYYCGHNNVFLNTLIQSDISKNICVFSFDHGFSLGLDNSGYDCYISKRPSDYEMLKNVYDDKVIYIPCWNKDKGKSDIRYIPYKNHSALITASAAARFYKLQGTENENYIDFVLLLLSKTNGKHVHIGPIEDEILDNIYKKMDSLGILRDKFVYIPWSSDIIQSLYDNCVDVFIEPFPTVSYKITLDVLSGGIPIISKSSLLRMQCADFFYPQNLLWNNKNEFIEVLDSLSSEDLIYHSKMSRKYFEETHNIDLIKPYFVEERCFLPPKSKCVDNILQNIDLVGEFLHDNYLYGTDDRVFNITAMEKIFSVKNMWKRNRCHKIVHILGFKMKFRNKAKELKSKRGR